MTQTKRISIHILLSNRHAEAAICLASLMRQTYKEWDLVLVDDSVAPITPNKWFQDLLARIKCEGHGVIYVRQDLPGNIGVNRNLAVKEDKFMNELIIRIDDDSFIEPDYVEKLVKTYELKVSEGYKVAAVGGVVPVFGGPRITKEPPRLFNEILFDEEGNITKLGDDGGFQYELKGEALFSHHLRSSFLFTKSAHEAVKGHPLEYGWNGFREETDLSLKWVFKGYTLWTDTSAICWHLQASGGSRARPPEEYKQLVMWNDDHFRKKVKYWYNNNKGALMNYGKN